jgi:hypothetical protein
MLALGFDDVRQVQQRSNFRDRVLARADHSLSELQVVHQKLPNN